MAEAFQGGDERGLEYFYKAFHPALSLYAFKYVGDHSTAGEIASVAFIKTWKMHRKLGSFGVIRAYLYKIVYRDSMNSLKQTQKREKSYRDSRPLTTDHYTPFEHLVRSETCRIVHTFLKELPPGQQKVIRMYYLEEKKTGQIEKELHLHRNTIETQRKRGLEALQKKLKEQGILRYLSGVVTALFKLSVAHWKIYPLVFLWRF